MSYNINFKAVTLWIGAIAVIAGGYFVLTSDNTSPIAEQESSLSLTVQQEEIKPGDTIRIEARDSEGPLEDVELSVNEEDIGDTNENGIAGYSVPEDAEEINISGEYEGATATVDASLENGQFNVDDGSDSTDGSDSADGSEDQDSEQDNQTDSTGSGETGLELDSSPVAGELNTVSLTKNGDPVEDTPVYVNNDEIGTTTSTGSLAFTVPNTEQITVSTDADIESQTFSVEGYTNETDSEDPTEDPEVLNAYYQYTPENPTAGTQVEFDASETTGNNIKSYEWSFGDGTTATGQTATHTYDSAGTYTVQLNVSDQSGQTDTIDADITVEQQAQPDLFLRKPDDGSEHTSTELQYNLTVYNGLSDSTYRIITNGNTVKTAQLGQTGTVQLTPTVTVPDGEFTTKAEIDQGGQTYTSQTKTVTAGITNTPDITLVSPADGGSVSTFDNQTDVNFEYNVNSRGWAETAELLINGQTKATRQLYSQESTQTETVTLDSGKTYNWNIQYSDGQGQQASTNIRTLEVVQEEASASTSLNSQTDGETINDYEVKFDYSVSSDVSSTFTGEVIADEDMSRTWQFCDSGLQEKTTTHSVGDTVFSFEQKLSGGQSLDTSGTNRFVVPGDYRIKSKVVSDKGEELVQNNHGIVTITEGRPSAESGDCGGGGDEG